MGGGGDFLRIFNLTFVISNFIFFKLFFVSRKEQTKTNIIAAVRGKEVKFVIHDITLSSIY